MEIRKLNAARGWLWIRHAYQLLLRNPLLGISGALASTLVVFAVLLLPLLGPLLAIALLPIMLAGYMRLCRALEENEPADLSLLLAGFRQHTRSLITLGAMLMLGMFFISSLMVFVGGAGFAALMEQVHGAQDMQVLVEALNNADSQVSLALLLGLSLLLVLVVAWQYAPILVFFSGISPWLALQASFLGTLRNIIPYMVYSLIMQLVAAVLGILPYGLGMILLLPLGLVSLYVSYRNIFPWLDEPQPSIPQGN
ncbi:MAG: BPSS1780 family membrane protein [Sideroxydans sp.]